MTPRNATAPRADELGHDITTEPIEAPAADDGGRGDDHVVDDAVPADDVDVVEEEEDDLALLSESAPSLHDEDALLRMGDDRARRRGNVVFAVGVLVFLCGGAFAGGRMSKPDGPKSLQEAQQQAQAGKLPYTSAGGTTGATGATGARTGQGAGQGFGGYRQNGGAAAAGGAGAAGGAPPGGGFGGPPPGG